MTVLLPRAERLVFRRMHAGDLDVMHGLLGDVLSVRSTQTPPVER